jgi:hypothetical protein
MPGKLYKAVDTVILVICLPFYALFVPLYLVGKRVSQIDVIRQWYWRRTYREGTEVSRFIACDIRRDVQVIDASKIGQGIITARTRTWNVLYARRHATQADFGPARQVKIEQLWAWAGNSWGGPVPIDADGAT